MELISIGRVESSLRLREEAPKQGDEGAPDAWLVFDEAMRDGLEGIATGDVLLVLTWLDRAERDVLRVIPRGDRTRGVQGVFNTRSPDRPNPIGLHRVEVLDGRRHPSARPRPGSDRRDADHRRQAVAAQHRGAMSRPSPPAPGPYLQTVSGRFVNPFDPDPEQLDPGDIARALANICRFGGHCRPFYSVAQHSVIVSELVEQRGGDVEDVFAALMHDAAEAYLGDMPHPIKHRSPLGAAFKEAEDHLESVLRERFSIKADVPEIKRIDRALLATERRSVSGESWDWPELEGVEALDIELVAVPARRGRARLHRALRRAAGPPRLTE